MGGFIADIVAWIVGRLFGRPAPESAEAVQAANAAKANVELAAQTAAASAETKIAAAEAAAPATKAAVIDTLTKGEF